MIALLALLTLVAYSAVWSAPFVYDDANWVGSIVPHAATPDGALASWPYWNRAPWRVAAWLSGGLPWAFHGLVLGLHLVNGLLLWTLARRWMSEIAAIVVLALFWLHPIQVEAVAYVSGGMEVLLTTYVLIALLGGLSESLVWNAIGAGSLWLAVTMKLSALPLLVAVPLVVFIVRGSTWRIVAVAAVAAFVSWPVLVVWATRSASLIARITALDTLAVSLGRYLALLVWPVGFSIEHPATSGPLGLATALLMLVIGLAWTLRTRWVAPCWACAWLAVLLLPRALVPHHASPLTEHHTMVPFLAIWLSAGSFVHLVTGASLHG